MVVFVDIVEIKSPEGKLQRVNLRDLTENGLYICLVQCEDLISQIKDEQRERIDDIE